MQTYSDFQNSPASEKVTLAVLYASRRLMGWSLHSGSVYKMEGIAGIISEILDSGTAYTSVTSIGALIPSSYFYDLSNKTIYLRTTGSDHPNGRFIVLRQKLCFASAPITLPHDLDSGYEVYWEPLIKSTSLFGVEIDTIAQTSEALEGSGTLTLQNDFDFWPANFDKLFFENQRCFIYSFNRALSPDQARLLFKGRVEKKSFSNNAIRFQLKDQFLELRSPISLGTIGELGLRTGSDLANAQQRLILGRVFGLIPVNVDQELEGYPLTGTVSIDYNDSTLTGSGTQFLFELSPDDQIVLDGVSFTVGSVSSNTSAELTEVFPDIGGLSGVQPLLLADRPKRFMNRIWKIAGHSLREPSTTVAAGSSIATLQVVDASDFYAGDWIYVGELGTGELVQIHEVRGQKTVVLRTSLAVIPGIGTQVRRPAVQNVRINDVSLVYYQDYTLDASTATLTLRESAEANSGPIRQLASSLVFTSGSRIVTGSGLKSVIFPGFMVGVIGNADFFEVLSVDSDTQLTLRTAATFSASTTGRYKALIFDPSTDILSLDVLGKTFDGTTSGDLLKTAPSIIKFLLTDAGLSGEINDESFTEAELVAFQHIGLSVPDTFNRTATSTYRDVINLVNKSVFGSLIQNSNFEFTFKVLQPQKPSSSFRFTESDLISFSIDSTAENMVKTCIVEYAPREYDYLTGSESVSTHQKSSDTANYILNTARERVIQSKLVDSNDARIHAARWAFLLEYASGRYSLTTKLQGATIEVGDIIDLEHRKMFDRLGGSIRRRLMLVESVKKSGDTVVIEATDLSNSFNRVSCFNASANEFNLATEEEKLYGGYFTDDYGLIENDPETHGTNLFW